MREPAEGRVYYVNARVVHAHADVTAGVEEVEAAYHSDALRCFSVLMSASAAEGAWTSYRTTDH